jgi:hypothetical protein
MEERRDGRKKSKRTERSTSRGRRFFFDYSLSFIIPHPSTYFVRTGQARKMSPVPRVSHRPAIPFSLGAPTHTFRTEKKKKKKAQEIGEDPLTTRSVSQCNQASGNLWWMIHQKEFTAFPFFPFFRYCFSLLNDNKTNYKKRLCYSMT